MATACRLKGVMVSAILGLVACFPAVVNGQESPTSQPSRQKDSVSDQELRSFAKVYLKTQKVRDDYRASAKDARDPKEAEKLRLEAASKLEKAIQEQGLSVESYNRIFAMVNTDEEIRNRTLKLIDAEREKS